MTRYRVVTADRTRRERSRGEYANLAEAQARLSNLQAFGPYGLAGWIEEVSRPERPAAPRFRNPVLQAAFEDGRMFDQAAWLKADARER